MVKTEHLVRFPSLKTRQVYSSLKWEKFLHKYGRFYGKGY